MICYLPNVQITSASSKISMIRIEKGMILVDFSFAIIDLRYAFSICLLFLFREVLEPFNHFFCSIDLTPPSSKNLTISLSFLLNLRVSILGLVVTLLIFPSITNLALSSRIFLAFSRLVVVLLIYSPSFDLAIIVYFVISISPLI